MTPPPKKAQALIAYVALHEGRPIPREQLAALLWRENDNEQARRSLRHCLMALRSALGSSAATWLGTEGTSVCFVATQDVLIDVRLFEALARYAAAADLEAAVALCAINSCTDYTLVRSRLPSGCSLNAGASRP